MVLIHSVPNKKSNSRKLTDYRTVFNDGRAKNPHIIRDTGLFFCCTGDDFIVEPND